MSKNQNTRNQFCTLDDWTRGTW